MTDQNFPALSVRQPWAELIISGRKQLEIRTWETDYRGPFWIHAGQHLDESLDARFNLRNLFRGGFIGSVELTSIEPIDERRWEAWRYQHLNPGPFVPGIFAWVLSNPKRLCSPLPARGHLGLYRVQTELLPLLSEVCFLS